MLEKATQQKLESQDKTQESEIHLLWLLEVPQKY